jgi:hypothetical protein
MTTPSTQTTIAWRWILIAAELLVAGYMVWSLMAGRAARHPSGAFAVIGIAAFVAWVFLFLGSPFVVRSQRWLAILGWCIAVATFISFWFPVTRLMGFITFILTIVVMTAVISFVVAALIRSNPLAIVASAVIAELLFVLYLLVQAGASPHAEDVLLGANITVIVGTPIFIGAAVGFTFLARRMYRKNTKS